MQRFGRYLLIRRIAHGGMADVWLSLYRPPHGTAQLAVIKRILPERAADPRFVELFLQEGRLSTQLDHPNIVRTMEMGCCSGQYYLALEYLRGQTVLGVLARFAEQRRFVPVGVVLRIATDVLAGLAYAHEARDAWGRRLGLVHRDVSPSNLFVSYAGASKVLDFGIARAEISATGRSPVKGKLPYVSPEQARGQPVDPRSDLFALGVVLHEMITLRPLFRGQNDPDTVRRILEQPVPRPSSLRATCPPELDDLILWLLERDPERRPPRAAAVLPRIDEIAGRLSVPPTPDLVGSTMRSHFSSEHSADRGLDPEVLLSTDPERTPPPRPRRRTSTFRLTGRDSEVTPVPA